MIVDVIDMYGGYIHACQTYHVINLLTSISSVNAILENLKVQSKMHMMKV